ncbi:MAG TPA: glycosyltransferase, partial [bacterium]|nr:glycosyltransferase [bacterium]
MSHTKIVHIYSSWTAGGAEKVMLDIAEGLEKKGFPSVLACPRDSYLFRSAGERGLTSYDFSTRGSFDPFGLWKLWRILDREKPDILHAHQGKVFWPCVFMKWLGKVPRIIFHRHAQLPHKFYSRSHYGWADAVMAISGAVASSLTAREKVSSSKVRVVYNGTDFARFHQ